jgi:hypothetical protein
VTGTFGGMLRIEESDDVEKPTREKKKRTITAFGWRNWG